MRITTISSTIASVVNHVIDSVVVAGVAVRTFLHLALMREHMGYWPAPCQPEYAFASDLAVRSRTPDSEPSKRLGSLRQCGIPALALCLTPQAAVAARLAFARAERQG